MCELVRKNLIVQCIRFTEQYPESVNLFGKNGYTPFMIACATGNTQIVQAMLRNGADVKLQSKYKESPFYLASYYYLKNPHITNASCIRELFYAGADINEPNSKGLTPLQMAAMFGHTSLAKWLLKKNASSEGNPDPVLLACRQGHDHTAAVIWKMTKKNTTDNPSIDNDS